MNDLEFIRNLEKKFKKKIVEADFNLGASQSENSYSLDRNGNIIALYFEFINFSGSFFGDPLKAIGNLSKLKRLSLFGCNLRKLPSAFQQLKKLEILNLGRNQLSQVDPLLGFLTQLKELHLGENTLITLPEELSQLINLESLNLSQNQIKEFPRCLLSLKKLKSLILTENFLESLPAEIKWLHKLGFLDLSSNHLKFLPQEVLALNMDLVVKESLPHSESEKFRKRMILLQNPQIRTPPLEILSRGRDAVRSYYQARFGKEERRLNEAKVLFVGEGGAGKTSLNKIMQGEEFLPNESQTHGIRIKRWDFQQEERRFQANFWDFGGQEIMHSTHQFFLSKRSVYVLILDARRDEDKIEYWLKNIETFGGESPILVVINKIDENPSYEVNRGYLQKKYPGIVGFYRLSCKQKNGLEDFTHALRQTLLHLEVAQGTWFSTWLLVKGSLEDIKKNYIEDTQYRKLCRDYGIENEIEQNTLIDYLHDLGVILRFQDRVLNHKHVMQPRWIVDGVYKILNSKALAEMEGVLNLNQLSGILNKNDYPNDTPAYIMELMKKFELCYPINSTQVLIPDLLNVEEKYYSIPSDEDQGIRFYLQYDFLPKSIFPRFMVRMHKYVKEKYRWRTGVVLDSTFGFAVIKVDEQQKEIQIHVSGSEKREFFKEIRTAFQEIHKWFAKLDVTEHIPLLGKGRITVTYQELIGHEADGVEFYYNGSLRKKFKVKDLLDKIENPEFRMKKPPNLDENFEETDVSLDQITIFLNQFSTTPGASGSTREKQAQKIEQFLLQNGVKLSIEGREQKENAIPKEYSIFFLLLHPEPFFGSKLLQQSLIDLHEKKLGRHQVIACLLEKDFLTPQKKGKIRKRIKRELKDISYTRAKQENDKEEKVLMEEQERYEYIQQHFEEIFVFLEEITRINLSSEEEFDANGPKLLELLKEKATTLLPAPPNQKLLSD